MELKDYKFTTTDIKGKKYIEINQRLMAFRTCEEFVGYTLESEIVHYDENSILIKAIIKDANDRIVATGIAGESKDTSTLNQTSFVENAETSAWGRALGCLGIGINTAVCTKEEVERAVNKQEVQPQHEVKQSEIVVLQDFHGQPVQYKHCFSKNKNQYFWALVNPADDVRSKKYINDADMNKILGR